MPVKIAARLVKGFSHLPAAELATNPSVTGQKQAKFITPLQYPEHISSDKRTSPDTALRLLATYLQMVGNSEAVSSPSQ